MLEVADKHKEERSQWYIGCSMEGHASNARHVNFLMCERGAR